MPTSTLTGQACSCLSSAMQCGCRARSSFLQAERPTCFNAGGMIDDSSDECYVEKYGVLSTPYPRLNGVLCTEYLVCNPNLRPTNIGSSGATTQRVSIALGCSLVLGSREPRQEPSRVQRRCVEGWKRHLWLKLCQPVVPNHVLAVFGNEKRGAGVRRQAGQMVGAQLSVSNGLLIDITVKKRRGNEGLGRWSW
jgi:hypothetical protein